MRSDSSIHDRYSSPLDKEKLIPFIHVPAACVYVMTQLGFVRTHLEVKRLATLREAHSDICPLAAVTLDTEDKVSRAVENRLNLRPRGGVHGLGEELAGRGVLRSVSIRDIPAACACHAPRDGCRTALQSQARADGPSTGTARRSTRRLCSPMPMYEGVPGRL
jgi:hypothetical protein